MTLLYLKPLHSDLLRVRIARLMKGLYLEFSVMKIRTFLEYLSDRIRTVSFSHMLMGGKLPFVAFVLTVPRELKQVTVL